MTRGSRTLKVEIQLEARRVVVNGKPLELLQRDIGWFELYTLLAYRRQYPDSGGTTATLAEIRHLNGWQAKVGTVARRLRRAMDNPRHVAERRLIVSLGPVMSGPYQLGLTDDDLHIEFSRSREAVEEFLGLPGQQDLGAVNLKSAAEYAFFARIADTHFNAGDFEAAHAAYSRAAEVAGTLQQLAHVMTRLARVSDRLFPEGRETDEVLAKLRAMVNEREHGDRVAQAILLTEESFRSWRRKTAGSRDNAVEQVHTALRLLRDETHFPSIAARLNNTLGLVAADRFIVHFARHGQEVLRNYEDAQRFFGRSLYLSGLAGDPYGPQAVFFNLAQLERDRGDILALVSVSAGVRALRSLPGNSHLAYSIALHWLSQCDQYCEATGIKAEKWLNALERSQLNARTGNLEGAQANLTVALRSSHTDRTRVDRYAGALARFRASGNYLLLLALTVRA